MVDHRARQINVNIRKEPIGLASLLPLVTGSWKRKGTNTVAFIQHSTRDIVQIRVGKERTTGWFLEGSTEEEWLKEKSAGFTKIALRIAYTLLGKWKDDYSVMVNGNIIVHEAATIYNVLFYVTHVVKGLENEKKAQRRVKKEKLARMKKRKARTRRKVAKKVQDVLPVEERGRSRSKSKSKLSSLSREEKKKLSFTDILNM